MRSACETAISSVAIAGAALLLQLGCGGSASTRLPPATPEQRTTAAATRFLDGYVDPDGRVARRDQGGDTVGEGQAYAMLLAAGLGDAKRFDAAWGWTKRNLRRPDGLISFRWSNGRVQDPQAASDADVDASRALLVAACRFNRPDLRQDALGLGQAIMGNETSTLRGAPVLTAGPWARANPTIVNPSYFSPAAFAALASATGDGRWGSLSATSRTVTSAVMQPPRRLPPDWARLDGTTPVPIGSPAQPATEPLFSFDAARTLVRMAEDPDPAGQRIAATSWPVFRGRDPATLPVEHALSGRPSGATRHPVVLVAAAGAAQAAGQSATAGRLLDAAERLDRRMPTYYGAAWVALGRMMLTTKALRPCS